MQLAATLGFILNSRTGKFLGLTPDERKALHECLTWLRQPGNNSLCFYGAELEAFDTACKKLMSKVKQIIPEASYRMSSLRLSYCHIHSHHMMARDVLVHGFELRQG